MTTSPHARLPEPQHDAAATAAQPRERILGLGCDVVHIPTMQRQIASAIGSRFLANILTPEEIARCQGEPQRLAQHWAGKEAIAKAVGSGWDAFSPRQIALHLRCEDSVMASVNNAPWGVRAADSTPWPNDAHLWLWSLSITSHPDYALAVALASLPHSSTIGAADEQAT